MLCDKHEIAAGPDGRCVLCRREANRESADGAKRLVALSTLGAALVIVALVVVRYRSAFSHPAVGAEPVAPDLVAEAPPPEPKPQRSRPPPETPGPPVASPARPMALGSTDPVAASPSASARGATPATPPAMTSQTRPSNAALASAISATPIVMFSTGWCGVCARARVFLTASGLRYSERDIDHDVEARDELKRRTGKTSIPTIEVDGKLLTPGFSKPDIMAAVAASVERRLGVPIEVHHTK